MFKQQRLEDLILESTLLKPTSTGWYVCKCPLCNDYKDRGGFKFDQGMVGYSCFNCGRSAKYEEFSSDISKNFRSVLNAFGIDDSSISAVVNSSFFNQKEETSQITLKTLTKVNTITPPTKLPSGSIRLGSVEDHLDYQQELANYLAKRCIDLEQHPFYFSLEQRFKNRIIIPFYRGGNLIYWQARSINDGEKKRYDNSPVSRDAVIYNCDALTSYNPSPLLVCEGVFDAMMFDGIAVLGSKMSAAKLELLRQSNRRLVFVIDKDKNGGHFAESVLSCEWEITFAPDGAADINQSVQRFGKAWTARQLIKHIPVDEASAKLAISINCR